MTVAHYAEWAVELACGAVGLGLVGYGLTTQSSSQCTINLPANTKDEINSNYRLAAISAIAGGALLVLNNYRRLQGQLKTTKLQQKFTNLNSDETIADTTRYIKFWTLYNKSVQNQQVTHHDLANLVRRIQKLPADCPIKQNALQEQLTSYPHVQQCLQTASSATPATARTLQEIVNMAGLSS